VGMNLGHLRVHSCSALLRVQPGEHQVIYYTWRSVGLHIPYSNKVHYMKWVSTSVEGVKTVWVYERCINFELLQYQYGVLYLSSLGSFFDWLLMDINKKKCKV
jgi:hypothetical protein